MTSLVYPMISNEPKSLHFLNQTKSRLNQFLTSKELNDAFYLNRINNVNNNNVKLEVYSCFGRSQLTFIEAVKQHFKPTEKGISLAPSWSHHWFRVTLTIPEEWHNEERIVFEFDPSCEAQIYNDEGVPLQGITGSHDINRRVDFPLLDRTRSKIKLYIEVSCNGMFGNGRNGNDIAPPDDDRTFKLEMADLVVYRLPAWSLFFDLITLRDLATSLPDNSPLAAQALEVANRIVNTFKVDDLDRSIQECRSLAERVFGKGWQEKGSKIYAGDATDASCWAIGNTHIDTAWLWPYSATRQKTARSWSTQLDLMNRYPEYRFVASQAQQFAWLEKDYPLLFDKIRVKVAEGTQFDVIGGCWVEMDTNLPSGEALIRQFLYGQRYFKSRFGKYCRTLWLPDSFGYSSQLPQLCRAAGFDFFFTQKLSWSEFNAPVHTTFRWVGQDQTQILTHMTPVNTYTAQASVGDVINSIKNHKSLQAYQTGGATGLLAFGNGDGGGGATAPMLESLRRCRAVADRSGELPKVTIGSSVEAFYEDILKKTENGANLPTWDGELYLELHRGTATSHGSIKRGNRKSENLLREIERVATFASIRDDHYRYPHAELMELWEGVLLNQFHDVLPGSAIGMVYIDAEKIYADVARKGSTLLESALSSLYPSTLPLTDSSSSCAELVGIELTSLVTRREVVRVPLEVAIALKEKTIIQMCKEGKEEAFVLFENTRGGDMIQVTSLEKFEEAGKAGRAQVVIEENGDGFVLSNSNLRVHVSAKGRILSLYDIVKRRELIKQGQSAGFVLFEDRPLSWDAWDVQEYHLETKSEVNATRVYILEDGPLRASVQAVYHLAHSVIKATICLDAFGALMGDDVLAMIRIDTEVDWHERHQFLKFEANLAISSDFASYENQFGVARRPTIRNTTWERAKFEVVGHRFADLSEFGYGCAILSESKYGFSCAGSTLRISLLRSPTSPDAECDQGCHTFSFALQPHRGSFNESDIPAIGIAFNNPLKIRKLISNSIESTSSSTMLFEIKGDRNIVLETIKRAEDDYFSTSINGVASIEEKTVIVRVYEAFGGHGRARLSTPLRIKSATFCDLLERDTEVLSLEVEEKGTTTSVELNLRGFQVISVKFILA